MLVAPRIPQGLCLLWSALVCYSLPWMLLVKLVVAWLLLAWPPCNAGWAERAF